MENARTRKTEAFEPLVESVPREPPLRKAVRATFGAAALVQPRVSDNIDSYIEMCAVEGSESSARDELRRLTPGELRSSSVKDSETGND